MDDRKYCVYKHTAPNGKVYIGVTCQNPKARWLNGKGYAKNEYFYRAIKKYGWDNFEHEIIATNLSQEEAYSMEIMLIYLYDSTNSDHGFNSHQGGQGSAPGHSWDEKTRKKHSEFMKGRTAGMFVGGKSPRARKVKQYDLNGSFIAEYGSTTEASKAVKTNYTSIVRCCRGQNTQSAKSLWCYSGEEDTIQEKVKKASVKKHLSETHKKHIAEGIRGKMVNNASISIPVIGISKETGEEIYFASISEAERHGFSAYNIGKCISDKYPEHKSANGYIWKCAI